MQKLDISILTTDTHFLLNIPSRTSEDPVLTVESGTNALTTYGGLLSNFFKLQVFYMFPDHELVIKLICFNRKVVSKFVLVDGKDLC